MILVRPADVKDAGAIGAIHVSCWRSTYANILPADYLAGLSATRLARHYQAAIAAGAVVLVATQKGAPRIVGFTTAGRPRRAGLADAEIETLYVLDDFHDQGIGTQLLQKAAAAMQAKGCQSLYLWVLCDNPSRWFYEKLGGEKAAIGQTNVAGQTLTQQAYRWNPITRLSTR